MADSNTQLWISVAALLLGGISALPQLATFGTWVGEKLGGKIRKLLLHHGAVLKSARNDPFFTIIYAVRHLGILLLVTFITVMYHAAQVSRAFEEIQPLTNYVVPLHSSTMAFLWNHLLSVLHILGAGFIGYSGGAIIMITSAAFKRQIHWKEATEPQGQ